MCACGQDSVRSSDGTINVLRRAFALLRRHGPVIATPAVTSVSEEPRMLATGWEQYARTWAPDGARVVPGARIEYLGDEWTAEDVSDGRGTTYGLAADDVHDFESYLERQLLAPHLPIVADEGLEIGPGGGRITKLLVPRTRLLHVADTSE